MALAANRIIVVFENLMDILPLLIRVRTAIVLVFPAEDVNRSIGAVGAIIPCLLLARQGGRTRRNWQAFSILLTFGH